nr:MAG TPA: hypothetical protein [Caudoviricetes sp.]
MSNLKTIQKMKGIVVIVMPESSQHVEVKMPSSITPTQFDAIMNRIKHDFFTTIKPQADVDSLVITTYDENEANALLSNASSVNAAKALIDAVGNPHDSDWSGRFFTLYGNGDPKVAQTILLLKQNMDLSAQNYLKSNGLGWLCDFLGLGITKFGF